MAEEILIAELRAVTTKFNQDLKRAERIANDASRDIAKGLSKIEGAVKDLPANFKRFNTELKSTESQSKRAIQATSGFSSALKGLRTAALAYISIQLAQQVGSVAKSFVTASERLEGVNFQLRNALGSADAAAAAFQRIEIFANRMAVNVLDSAQSFARLVVSAQGSGVSVGALELIYQSFTKTAVANRIAQEDLNRIFVQLLQGIAKQKFELEDLKSIAEAGVPVFQALASALNIDISQVFKLVSQGKIGLNEIIKLAIELDKRFTAGAENAARSIPNQFRRMFNEIGQDFTEFTDKVLKFDELQETVRLTKNLIDTIFDSFKEGSVQKFFREMIDIFNSFIKAATVVVGIFQTVIELIDKFAAKVGVNFGKSGISTFIFGDLEAAERGLNRIRDLFGLPPLNLLEKTKEDAKEIAKEVKSLTAKPHRLVIEVTPKRFELSKELRDLIFENNARIAREAAQAQEMALEAVVTGRTVLPPEKSKRLIEDLTRPFEIAAERIQGAFGDLFTDIFSGQIDSIKSFADAMKDIFARTAGEIAAGFASKALFENLLPNLQKTFLGKDGILTKLGASLGINVGQAGKIGGSVLGGAGLGLGIGSTASGLLSGIGIKGPVGGALAGGLGGAAAGLTAGLGIAAATGATAGSIIPGIGTAIGAGIGALIGGLAPLFQADRRTRINLQTTPRSPLGGIETQARSPFGFISLLTQGTQREGGAIEALAEFDRAIAAVLPERLNKIVEQAFQSPTGNIQVSSESSGEAIARLIQSRAFDVFQNILGTGAAENIVGFRGVASQEGLAALQQRVTDALGIIATIEEFQFAGLTDAGKAIRRIREEFADLVRNAQVFGIPTAKIFAEENRQLREFGTQINRENRQRILEITDPDRAQREGLAFRQQQEIQAAIEANREAGRSIIDVAQINRLHALERKELEKELADVTETASSAISDLSQRIQQFARAGLSPVKQQLLALAETFRELFNEAREAGRATEGLRNAYERQRQTIVDTARTVVQIATAQIVQPFRAAMLQIEQQLEQFRQQVRDGVLNQPLVTAFGNAAIRNARFQEANRIVSGGGGTAEAQFQATLQNFLRAGGELGTIDQQIQALNEQTRNLREAMKFLGLPIDALNEAYRRQWEILNDLNQQQKANEVLNQALQVISGGATSPITQVADAFNAFIQAGNPLSAFNQQLFDLTEQFVNLKDASELLGISTADIEASFLSQVEAIKEARLAEIDASLEPRRQGITSINEFLRSLRLDQSFAGVTRFAEAQRQFQDAAGGTDLNAAIGAGQTFLDIARQQFGSTAGFQAARNEINDLLTDLRNREQAAIEAERQRLVQQDARELQQLSIARDSFDELQRIRLSNRESQQGIQDMLVELRAQKAQNEEIIRVLNTRLGV